MFVPVKGNKDNKIVQVILKDKKVIEAFDQFVQDESRSESNAGELIFKKFFDDRKKANTDGSDK